MSARSSHWHPIALGSGYFLLAAAAVACTRYNGGVAFIWMATALLLARLASRPLRRWAPDLAACGLASFAATALFGFGPAAAAPLVVINLGEAMIGAALLRRWTGGTAYLDSLPGLSALLVAGGLAAPFATGLAAAAVADWMTAGGYWPNLFHWFTGHAVGAIVFTPIFGLFFSGDLGRWAEEASSAQAGRVALVLAAVSATSGFVFSEAAMPLLFLPTLPIVIAAFFLGRLGAAVSVMLLALIGGTMTLEGLGPIVLLGSELTFRLEFFQFYVAVTAITALPVAAELKQRKRLFQQLRESEARYRLVTDNATDLVLNIGADDVIRYISPSVQAIFGYAPEALIGKTRLPFIHPDDRAMVLAAHEAAFARPEETFTIQYRGLLMDGSYSWMEAHKRGVTDPDSGERSVLSVVRDIAQRKALELRLAQDASTDPLTGLANRRLFDERLDALVAAARQGGGPACLAMFDLDHFKAINDRFGHAIGDEALIAFARAARKVLRDSDLIARLGGEEFGLLLGGADIDQAVIVCERLRSALAASAIEDAAHTPVPVQASAGLVPIDGGRSPAELLRVADEALYEAKREGRNRLKLAA